MHCEQMEIGARLGGEIFTLLLFKSHDNDWDLLFLDEAGAPRPGHLYILLLMSCVIGIAIGWAGVNAQALLTATSFLVVGNVNKFVVILAGIVLMQEASSWQAVLGCVIAISGGALYARARSRLDAAGRCSAVREVRWIPQPS